MSDHLCVCRPSLLTAFNERGHHYCIVKIVNDLAAMGVVVHSRDTKAFLGILHVIEICGHFIYRLCYVFFFAITSHFFWLKLCNIFN